jgi:hypothetical protein
MVPLGTSCALLLREAPRDDLPLSSVCSLCLSTCLSKTRAALCLHVTPWSSDVAEWCTGWP